MQVRMFARVYACTHVSNNLELGQPEKFGNFLEQNLDEDARGGRGVVLVQLSQEHVESARARERERESERERERARARERERERARERERTREGERERAL